MDRIFVDTGAWYAFFNRGDADHEAVAAVLMEWEGRLVTSDYVFDELVTLIRIRVGHGPAREAGNMLRSEDLARVVAVDQVDRTAAWRRFAREADKRCSFTDCTSFALMKRLAIPQAAAVDADFRRAGFQVLP